MRKINPSNVKQNLITEKQINALRNEPHIARLLKENKIKITDLNNHYQTLINWVKAKKESEVCLGLKYCKQPVPGYFYDLDFEDLQIPILRPCRCLLKYQAETKHLKQFVERDYPDNLIDKKFSNIDLDNESADYLQIVDEISRLSVESLPGVFLSGPVGVGKTFLAACLANQAASNGFSVAFVHMPTFAFKIRGMALDKDQITAKLNLLSRCKVLVLDDIGAEAVTLWLRDEILLPILNYRMEAELFTVFTSNFTIEDLKIYYATTKTSEDDQINALRIVERISFLAKEFKLSGESRRRRP